jgi:pyrophosphatase PpaX
MAPRFGVVLFDLDGTLANTNDLILQTFRHILTEKLGLEVPDSEIIATFGEPLPKTFERWEKDPERISQLVDEYRKWNVEKHNSLIREFDGVHDMIFQLKDRGIKLAIVTSKKTSTAHLGLKAVRIADAFDVVVGLNETTEHKPNAGPALHALKLLEEEPSDKVLMVGDSNMDILCGRNAGVKTCGVGWSVLKDALLASKPDHFVESTEELLELILGEEEKDTPASGAAAT